MDWGFILKLIVFIEIFKFCVGFVGLRLVMVSSLLKYYCIRDVFVEFNN